MCEEDNNPGASALGLIEIARGRIFDGEKD